MKINSFIFDLQFVSPISNVEMRAQQLFQCFQNCAISMYRHLVSTYVAIGIFIMKVVKGV